MSWRERIGDALAEGCSAASLHAVGHGAGARVVLVLVRPDGGLRLEETVADADASVPTLVDLAPALGWDEREAHDLHGVVFRGHEPLRPLVDHDLGLASWTVPVDGDDAYQVAVGPIHAGVIESGHFRFHLVGDRILFLDARLAYKHRGLERAAEGLDADGGLAVIERACAACSVANAVAYASAWEALRGLAPDAGLARARTVLLELERLWSHLNDLSAVCAGVGLAAGTHRFGALSEDARRLNAEVTGHRYLRGAVAVGGSALALDAPAAARLREALRELRTAAERGWRALVFSQSFQDRLDLVGIVTPGDARRLGAVGPPLRATGVAEDARTASPGLAYAGLVPAIADRPRGDVTARVDQRAAELWQTLDLLDDLLAAGPLAPVAAVPGAAPAPGVARVESARGATVCVVEPDAAGRLARVRLRTGSYANWPVVAHSAAGNLLPDFPLINKSFELCYACADR